MRGKKRKPFWERRLLPGSLKFKEPRLLFARGGASGGGIKDVHPLNNGRNPHGRNYSNGNNMAVKTRGNVFAEEKNP